MANSEQLQVISSNITKCAGTNKDNTAPLRGALAHPSITVFSTGAREVGCIYLQRTGDKALCAAEPIVSLRIECPYLNPASSSQIVESENKEPIVANKLAPLDSFLVTFLKKRPLKPEELKRYKTLEFLVHNPNRLIPYSELLREIWGNEDTPKTRTNLVASMISRLNREEAVRIITIRETGYIFPYPQSSSTPIRLTQREFKVLYPDQVPQLTT